MTAVELELAKNIGEQMSGKIICPRKCIAGQELSAYGDYEDMLYCPHCEMEVEITVRWRGRHSSNTHECDGTNCPPRAHDHKVTT